MLARDVLDAQVTLELPTRELLAAILAGGAGHSSRLGDILQLFLLRFLPEAEPIVAP